MTRKKAKSVVENGGKLRQVAALPYRKTADGRLQILLITSRETKRFIIPKGWPMADLEDWQAAEIETREESGAVGEAERKRFGVYTYWKRVKGAFVPIEVDVYPLEVVGDLPRWKESRQRRRGWIGWEQATLLIDEPHLISVIEAFANREDA